MEIQIFKDERFGEVRTMVINGDENVDSEDKTTFVISESGSKYKSKTTFINESGLYALILSSKLPQAKEFKRWVTSEVLPQIRSLPSRGSGNHCKLKIKK